MELASPFKALEINLTKRSLGYYRIHLETALLLTVHCKMLNGSRRSAFFNSTGLGTCHGAGYIGIFRKIFEVSSI